MALPEPTSDTTVLVTGASSGVGTCIAHELASRGHNLTLAARRRDRLTEIARDLHDEFDVEVDVLGIDVSSDRARARLERELRSGRELVGLCNNAGQAGFGNVVEHDKATEESIFRTNALAMFDLTNRFVRDFVDRGEGAILNTGSITGFAPHPHHATYAATKAFIQSWSEALHTELAGTGVSCTVASLGPTRTPIWEDSDAGGFEGFGGPLIWQSAADAARDAVQGMVEGRRTVLPGITNKLALLGYRYTPRTALLPIARELQARFVRD
jgi:hypothetical protein